MNHGVIEGARVIKAPSEVVAPAVIPAFDALGDAEPWCALDDEGS